VTKTDLVNAVAKSVEGITKKKAAEVVDAVFEGIHCSLKKEDKVQIVGFGTFEVQKRAARQGRNPQDPKKSSRFRRKKSQYSVLVRLLKRRSTVRNNSFHIF